MNIKSTKLSKSKTKLEIETTAEEVQKFFDEAYEKLAPGVDIKGFRPGKAPKMLTIQTIGQNRYNSEALNLAIPQIYYQAVKQEKIIPVGQPRISIKQFAEGEPFRFDAEADILPEIKIGDWKKLKIKNEKVKTKYEADKNEVEKVIKRLQYQGAKYSVTTEPAKVGDRVEIDFAGKVGGVKKEHYSSKHYPLILGEKILQPGFEEKLNGKKKGDRGEFDLEIKHRHNDHEHKEMVNFEVTVNEVWKVELPELNEDFVKKFGHKKTEDLKVAIKKSIVQEKEMRDRQILEGKIIDELLKISEVEAPQGLVDQEVARRIGMIQGQTGPGFSKYLESIKTDMVGLQAKIRPVAERAVKISLLLGELAKKMGFLKPEKLAKIKENKEAQVFQQKAVKEALDKLIESATSNK